MQLYNTVFKPEILKHSFSSSDPVPAQSGQCFHHIHHAHTTCTEAHFTDLLHFPYREASCLFKSNTQTPHRSSIMISLVTIATEELSQEFLKQLKFYKNTLCFHSCLYRIVLQINWSNHNQCFITIWMTNVNRNERGDNHAHLFISLA